MTRKEELRIQRAELILRELQTLQKNSSADGLRMGNLLTEFKTKRLYTIYNYSSMKSWLEQGDIGIPASVAEKLMTIVSRAKDLGIDLEEYESLGLARLGVIFSLHPSNHAEKILELLDTPKPKSVNQLKEEVRNHLTGNRADNKVRTLTFRVSERVFADITDIKRETGLPTFSALALYFKRKDTRYVVSGEVEASGDGQRTTQEEILGEVGTSVARPGTSQTEGRRAGRALFAESYGSCETRGESEEIAGVSPDVQPSSTTESFADIKPEISATL